MTSRILLATSASADCAWVLWSQKSTLAKDLTNVTTDPAQPDASFQAVAECDSQAKSHATSLLVAMRAAGAKRSEVGRIYGGWRTVFERENEAGAVDFKCFPDTIDPRGPKRK